MKGDRFAAHQLLALVVVEKLKAALQCTQNFSKEKAMKVRLKPGLVFLGDLTHGL